MKKVVSVILCMVFLLILLTLLNKCESYEPPKGMSRETYDIGVEVLGITDKCIDGKIEKEEAVERITKLYKQLEGLIKEYFEKRKYVNGINTNSEPDEFTLNNYIISNSKSIIKTLDKEKFSKTILLMDRNLLADNLGKRNR